VEVVISFFINFYQLYVYILLTSPGIFFICYNFSSSSLINTTFTDITYLYSTSSYGGSAVYINTPNYYSLFTIDCCIFTKCKAPNGGALYLENPYVYIIRTRFENNEADIYGNDIYVGSSPCFNKKLNKTLSSSVCSTTPLGNRVNCSGDVSQLQNTCSEEIV
jgi:hypothetical protein